MIFLKILKRKFASGTESNGLNRFLRIRRIMEHCLEHLFIIPQVVLIFSTKPISNSISLGLGFGLALGLKLGLVVVLE